MKKNLLFFKNPAIMTAVFLNIAFILLGIYYIQTNVDAFTRYTKEDGFVEWMQFLTFTTAALFLFFVTFERIHRGEAIKRLENLGILCLGLLFFFASMEEISWFQRIADIQASDFFLSHNKQAETNLHNLKIGDVGINKLIFGKILFIGLIFHNVILPFLSIKKPKIRHWVESKGLFLPPLQLVAVYLSLAIILEIFVVHKREKEILEAIGAIHYLTCAFLTYGMGLGYSKPIFSNLEEKRRAGILFSVFLVFLTYVSWILGNMSLKDFLL